ncbi:right-handed parallel beta-helix repeat-containing protein [Paenibacillus allorhizosphaerae]|uniref:Right-handed parallel beta-helix repeat-containing protein n=1 Tax=Paenibacillus allorhizosphaerae TaxID=2849866 RepID=A0ABM8VP17_9BACL|nr:right-handed parallel beta-helix repeat-containing protein [Paenibacillus allorhizosphaerae]CAG7652327.1 hypothetical protein PAECIP111802_05195 [Paenibacillus allorhizosphaerae]
MSHIDEPETPQAANQTPDRKEPAISRRGVIMALGAAGITLAAHALLNGKASYADGGTVTDSVYDHDKKPKHSAHLDWLSVKDYGAKGDGAADDTKAFQDVLDQALTGASPAVYVPKGVYRLTKMLRIYRNTKLMLHHDAVMLRCHNDSFLLNGASGAAYDAYGGHGNITIEGGIWDGNIIQYPDAYVGFNFGHAANIAIRDLTIKDVVWAHAIEINASRDVSVEHCRFLGYKNADDGSRFFSEAIQIDVPTKLSFAGFGKYDGTPCRNITVRDCYFGASGTAGTTAWACGVGTHGAIHDVWSSNIKILGNTFENLTYWAIRLFKWNDCLVEGNTMLQCGGGVLVSTPSPNSESTKDKDGNQRTTPQAGKGIRIVDNVITGASVYGGIGSYGDKAAPVADLYITGNIVYETGTEKHAITASWCRSAVIERNIVYSARRGVHLENTSDSQVSGNRLESIVVNGIESSKCTGVTIDSNVVRNSGFYGILVSETTGFSVHRNIIDSASQSEHNRYDGIIVSTRNSRGSIHSNTVRKAAAGKQNRYGLQISASSEHIDTSQNILEGVSGAYLNASATSSDRLLLYSAGGSSYQLTVDETGQIITTKI